MFLVNVKSRLLVPFVVAKFVKLHTVISRFILFFRPFILAAYWTEDSQVSVSVRIVWPPALVTYCKY